MRVISVIVPRPGTFPGETIKDGVNNGRNISPCKRCIVRLFNIVVRLATVRGAITRSLSTRRVGGAALCTLSTRMRHNFFGRTSIFSFKPSCRVSGNSLTSSRGCLVRGLATGRCLLPRILFSLSIFGMGIGEINFTVAEFWLSFSHLRHESFAAHVPTLLMLTKTFHNVCLTVSLARTLTWF